MNEFEKSNQQDVSAVSKRRSFLKKTATGAVVFSLPAKSVWGACSVSGAMSGNLSTNQNRHDCNMPELTNGRSPGYWKECLENDNLHAIFSHLNTAKSSTKKNSTNSEKQQYEDTKNCYRAAVEAVMSHEMVLPSELNPLSMTVSQGLASNGQTPNNIYFHLAAVYLNTYFGLYPNYTSDNIASATQAITDVYLYWYMSLKTNSTVSITDNMLGYNDGTTVWQPTNC